MKKFGIGDEVFSPEEGGDFGVILDIQDDQHVMVGWDSGVCTKCSVDGLIEPPPADMEAVAFKFADPTEDARWVFSEEEAAEIASEDPSLILWMRGYGEEAE